MIPLSVRTWHIHLADDEKLLCLWSIKRRETKCCLCRFYLHVYVTPQKKYIFLYIRLGAPGKNVSSFALFFSAQTVNWIRVYRLGDEVGRGHSGLGRCRPSMSGVSWGLWVALVGVQSPREAWAALR